MATRSSAPVRPRVAVRQPKPAQAESMTTKQLSAEELSKLKFTTKPLGVYDEPDEDCLPVTSLGDGVRVVSDSVIKLDAATATTMLELPCFEAERALDTKHVNYLQKTMVRGTFRPELVVLAVAYLQGERDKMYRINGQHTCWAVLEMANAAYEVRNLVYECATPFDLRQLYASYDRHKGRTVPNVMASYLLGTGIFAGVNRYELSLLAAATRVAMFESRTEQKRQDSDSLAYLMQTTALADCQRTLRLMQELRLSSASEHKSMRRAGIVAAIMLTSAKSLTAAREFWAAVVTGVGITVSNDPRLRLRNFLMSSVGVGGGGTGSSYSTAARRALAVKRLTPEETLNVCLRLWNAWRDNETTVAVHVPATRPKVK